MALPDDAAEQCFWGTHFFAFSWKHHSAMSPEIISYLYELRTAQSRNIASEVAPAAKSAAGLYESDFDLLKRDHVGLQLLRGFIEECVQQTVSHLHGGRPAPSELSVDICDSWFHITNDGGFHDAHAHGFCSWCGIYYLQVGESGSRTQDSAPNGGNRFYSPLWRGGNYEDLGNSYLSHVYVDPPISDGMLLLFPSYLMHSGLPYRGTKDRIVISVNTRTLPASSNR